MPDLSPDARFGAYRLIRPLGKGGFAEVWEAESEGNGRRVALKVLTELRADERGLERFRQEGRIAASLANPHCVYVFDAGAHEQLPYIAMELVQGGTLAERIHDGPLPPRAAVDVVLDVLEGLESAQQAGILHRDVKPSNVFLGADGRAKIGDFGISKSLEVDSHLSQTGAFLGTPYYASPEQIAAEPLDLRSDLYSVGAMLYELVTGKLPHQGTSASAVLAQVLTKDPVPFAQHDVAVPAGLQRVILRLLAKPREKRFQSYAQLRAALLPLSSRGLAPAGPARRFGAIMVDFLLFLPLGVALGTLTMSRGVSEMAVEGIVALLRFVYFTLTERYWGASVGKRLLGLRVTGADGTTPSLGRVAGRTACFLLLYGVPALLVVALAGGARIAANPLLRYAPSLLRLLGIAALLSTMRRRNGFAGLHELASGTRVMELLAGRRAGAVPRVAPPLEPVAAGAAYGPYQATGTLWRDPNEALLVARDNELHRDVWIHEVRDAAAAPPVDRLRARGEGSLPWLQRGARDGVTWDAYGAPQGTPLERWAVERGGLAWREMRDVLLSLTRELESRCARDGVAGPLSPRHVWVDPSGRALLLDFPARPASASAAGDPAEDVTPERAPRFVSRVASLGFQGRAVLPEYARACMAGLGGSSVEAFRASLERVASRPAEVSRARRAGPFAVLAVVAACVVLLRLAMPAMMASLPAWYRDIAFNGDSYLAALRRADSVPAAGEAADSARRIAAAVQVVLAAAARDTRTAPQGATLLGALSPPLRAAIDSAARRYPAPDSQAVADARARLAAAHVGSAPLPLRGGLAVVPKAMLQSFTVLAYLGIGGVVLALLLRGGFLLRLFGIGVVRSDGTPAGRLRCTARSLIAWSPLLLLLAFAALPGGVRVTAQPSAPVSVTSSTGPRPANTSPTPGLPPWLRWTLGAVAVAGAAYAVWRPARGVAERASGTVLVPR